MKKTQKKKILVIYYSRTGTTEVVAKALSKELSCDYYEIFDLKERMGAINWLICGKDAMKCRRTRIKEPKIDFNKYSLVFIGTPNWARTLTPAIRTFILNHKSEIKNAAFFCTGTIGPENVFSDMEKLFGKKPVYTLFFKTSEVRSGEYTSGLKEFTRKKVK